MSEKGKASGRNSAIELLRILAMCGVVILHYNNANIGGGFTYAGGINRWILQGLESIFICAVNLYILISGYFLSGSEKRRAIKPIELVAQVVLFGLTAGLLRAVLQGDWSIRGIISMAIPNNYFVTLYVTLYLLSPYLNLVFQKLSGHQMKVLVGLLLALFSVWLTALELVKDFTGSDFQGMSTVNAYGSQAGYTIVNFALMYTLGAYIRRFEEALGHKPWYVFVAVFLVNAMVLAVWSVKSASAWSYSNPLVIANACLIFLAFKQWKFQSRAVNTLAKGAFSCFLLHGIFITRIGIQRAVTASAPVMLAHVALSAVSLYLICWVAWAVWNAVTAKLFRRAGEKMGRWDAMLSLTDEE